MTYEASYGAIPLLISKRAIRCIERRCSANYDMRLKDIVYKMHSRGVDGGII